MVFRSIALVAVLSVASAAAAQTVVDPQISPEVLRQVSNFENDIRRAIEQAGAQLADSARKAIPDAQLQLEAQPYAKGHILPTGDGILFAVEVPAIEGTSALLYEAMVRQLQQQLQQQNANPNPNAPRVGSTTTTIDLVTDPRKQYADLAHEALVDAILDRTNTLPLKPGQSLTLSVGNYAPASANPLAPAPKRLYLTIKAEDLLALRQGTITRDEAKSRIIEKRY